MDDALSRLLARPIAHRGLHGCGEPGLPVENSLDAAEAAAAAGFGIECDVRLSRDGVVMVFHDETLERLTGVAGPLAARTAAELAALPLLGGEGIPTLAALLERVDRRVPVVVEVKAGCDVDLTEKTLAILSRFAGWSALESFDPAVVDRALDLDPAYPVGLVGPPEQGDDADPELAKRCAFLSWSIDRLADAISLAPRKPLSTWTVRTPAQREIARRHRAQIVFEGLALR